MLYAISQDSGSAYILSTKADSFSSDSGLGSDHIFFGDAILIIMHTSTIFLNKMEC